MRNHGKKSKPKSFKIDMSTRTTEAYISAIAGKRNSVNQANSIGQIKQDLEKLDNEEKKMSAWLQKVKSKMKRSIDRSRMHIKFKRADYKKTIKSKIESKSYLG